MPNHDAAYFFFMLLYVHFSSLLIVFYLIQNLFTLIKRSHSKIKRRLNSDVMENKSSDNVTAIFT